MCHHGRTRCPKWPLQCLSPQECPSCFVPLKGILKINKCVWPRHLSNHCVCLWNLKHMRFCACPVRIEFLLLMALQLSCKPPWFSKPIVLGAHLPSARPWAGNIVSWMPNSLGRTSCLWVISSWIWVFTKLHLCHSFPSCCGSFFMPLVAENFSASL